MLGLKLIDANKRDPWTLCTIVSFQRLFDSNGLPTSALPLLLLIILNPDPEVLVPPYPENFEAVLGITQGSLYTWSYRDNNEMVTDMLKFKNIFECNMLTEMFISSFIS